MSMLKVIVTSCLLSMLLIPQTIMAANVPKAFTVSPQIGGYRFEGNQDGKLDAAFVYSIAVGYNYNQNIGVEAGYSYVATENEREKSNNFNTGRLDLLYHLVPENTLVPFIIGGVGLTRASINNDDDIILEYGVGLKYFITDTIALRTEVKHIFDINNNDDHSGQNYYNNLAYTVGMTFHIKQ